jgi:hypothetical protein
MPRERSCTVCQAIEPKTIDRLLVFGYGPRSIAERWGLRRHHVNKHRNECLVGERRQAVEADLRSGEGVHNP